MIKDPNFSLDLGHPWRRTDPGGGESYGFCDDDRDILIIVSAVSHKGAAPGDLAYLAELLADLKLRAEVDAARIFGNPATFYEPIIAPQPWGQAVLYYGHDEAGRQFGYSGTVTRDCTINLYMLSQGLGESELFGTMDEIFSKIAFDRTPLDTAPHWP